MKYHIFLNVSGTHDSILRILEYEFQGKNLQPQTELFLIY